MRIIPTIFLCTIGIPLADCGLFGRRHSEPPDDCKACVESNGEWCVAAQKCDVPWCPTQHSVLNILNCPVKRDEKFEYDDEFVRTKVLITTAAVGSNNPQICFDSQMPTMKLYATYNVNCSIEPPDVTCFAYTSIDTTQKVIAVVFRGTQNSIQLVEELLRYFYNSQIQFFDIGRVFSYFYEAFVFLLDGGMEKDILQLHHDYPDYEIWVNGHSMGGALASLAASWMVRQHRFKADKIKLVTMGQPRTGDYDYATWHDKTFPYSYRIVHNRDIIPHVPPQFGFGASLYHHRTEIWYPNDMELGSKYEICQQADGYYCSATLDFNLTNDDHGHYFVKEMPAWGGAGCPTFWI